MLTAPFAPPARARTASIRSWARRRFGSPVSASSSAKRPISFACASNWSRSSCRRVARPRSCSASRRALSASATTRWTSARSRTIWYSAAGATVGAPEFERHHRFVMGERTAGVADALVHEVEVLALPGQQREIARLDDLQRPFHLPQSAGGIAFEHHQPAVQMLELDGQAHIAMPGRTRERGVAVPPAFHDAIELDRERAAIQLRDRRRERIVHRLGLDHGLLGPADAFVGCRGERREIDPASRRERRVVERDTEVVERTEDLRRIACASREVERLLDQHGAGAPVAGRRTRHASRDSVRQSNGTSSQRCAMS